jgi:type IV pilus assembly protein PilA
MRQMLKNKLKEQKGLTLIELLAVIVILGIIAAIAVPSVLGIIENTKEDAHVANAQQMIGSAKMAIASNPKLQVTMNDAGTAAESKYLSLTDLEEGKLLDSVKSPDSSYIKGLTSNAKITSINADSSYVKIYNGKVVGIKLISSDKGILKYLSDADVLLGKEISTQDIVRGEVQKISSGLTN